MKRITDSNGKYISSNSYIKMEVIFDTQLNSGFVKNITSLKNIHTNQDISLQEFMDKLIEHEEKFNKQSHRSNRYGVVFTILLDKKRPDKELKKLSKLIAERYDNLPYYSFYTTQGKKGHYLVIYFCERHYFPKGFKQTYETDIYVDKDTRRPVKIGAPNSIKLYSKGQVMNNPKTLYFSNKKQYFSFAHHKSFNAAILDFKNWFITTLENTFNAVIDNSITLTKYAVKKASFYCRENVEYWNKIIRHMEDYINNVYIGMYHLKLFNEDNERKLFNILDKYRNILKKREFNYQTKGKKKIKLFIDFNDISSASHLLSKCEEDTNNLLLEMMN